MQYHRKFGLILIIFLITTIPAYGGTRMTNDDLARAISVFDQHDYSTARSIFETIARNEPKNATAAFYLGRIYLIENNSEQALSWLNKAIEWDQDQSDYYLWLARALGMKAQEASVFKRHSIIKSVREAFEKAIALNPNNLEARLGLLQFYIGVPGIMGGSQEQAEKQAGAIQRRDSSLGHLARGMLQNSRHKPGLAEKEFLAAIEANPETFQAYYQLAYLYSVMKKPEKAMEVIDKLIASYPAETDAYFHGAKIAVILDYQLDRAIEYLQKYLQTKPGESSPSLASAHHLLGVIYQKKGDTEGARQQFQSALQLNPHLEVAKKALKNIKK